MLRSVTQETRLEILGIVAILVLAIVLRIVSIRGPEFYGGRSVRRIQGSAAAVRKRLRGREL